MSPTPSSESWETQVRRFRLGEITTVSVLDTLRPMELLVPVLPGANPAACTVAAPASHTVRVLPVFTSETAVRAYDPAFHAVRTDVAGMALAARGAETGYVLIDPGMSGAFSLRPRMLEALAAGIPWAPPWNDSRVSQAVREAVSTVPSILDVHIQPGDPSGRLEGPEVLVLLDILTGPDAGELAELSAQLLDAWQADHRIRDRVDSLGVRYHPVHPC